MRRALRWATPWNIVAVVILTIAGYATYVRFFQGLGAATNLSDQFPWGLWIGFDVLVGVGLAAGGFTITASVHILNIKKYEPVNRPALLTAFLGYLLVCIALLFDIGRPLRLWHPLIMWNPHSVMFEVAWCVTLYTTVLALEFSPMVFEKLNLKFPLKVVRALYMPLVIAGVLLSTLHQSSLGTVYLIVPDKLHGLWYSPLLPAFFFLSAIAAGLSMAIVESFLSARAFGRRLEHDVLCGLGRVTVVVLAVFIVWKFMDLYNRGNLPLAFEYSPQSVMFWAEVGIGAVIPMMILLLTGDQVDEGELFLSALLVVVGFALNRLNVSVIGMLHSDLYFPRWTELAVTAGMIAGGVVIFGYAVRHLKIYSDDDDESPSRVRLMTQSPLKSLIGLAALALIFGVAFMNAPPRPQRSPTAIPPSFKRPVDPTASELPKLPADKQIATSGNSPGKVTFRHSGHMAYVEKQQCGRCHTRLFPFKLTNSRPSHVGEQWHGKQACGSCHNGGPAFGVTDDTCGSCHTD